jgi:hypothetical protein
MAGVVALLIRALHRGGLCIRCPMQALPRADQAPLTDANLEQRVGVCCQVGGVFVIVVLVRLVFRGICNFAILMLLG